MESSAEYRHFRGGEIIFTSPAAELALKVTESSRLCTLSNPAEPTGQDHAHLIGAAHDFLTGAFIFIPGSMVNKKKEKEKEKEQDRRPAEVDIDSEKQSPGWVQKYLDLADLLMKRFKEKRDHTHSKAA